MTVSFEPDMISYDDSNEPRAQMPCGHVISSESMIDYIKNIIANKQYTIKCPSIYKGKMCDTEWDFDFCKIIAVLDDDEQTKIESGI